VFPDSLKKAISVSGSKHNCAKIALQVEFWHPTKRLAAA